MANLNKRAPEVTSMPRGLSGSQVNEVFQRFRRQNSMNSDVSSASLAAMSASFSSACSCQTYSGVTITETYTDQPEVGQLRHGGVLNDSNHYSAVCHDLRI